MTDQSFSELNSHLADAVEFLVDANDNYDDGNTRYMKQIANQVRLLVHQSRTSHALLEQMGYLSQWQWVDEAEDLSTGNWAPTVGPVAVQVESPGPDSIATVSYQPYLGEGPGAHLLQPQKFEIWWRRPIVRDTRNREFSRADLVLRVANKDGGSHVDPTVPPEFDELKNSGSLGQVFVPSADGSFAVGFITREGSRVDTSPNPQDRAEDALVKQSPVPALIRQISYEVLSTVAFNLPDVLGPVTARARTREGLAPEA